jgi:hypothetical protein
MEKSSQANTPVDTIVNTKMTSAAINTKIADALINNQPVGAAINNQSASAAYQLAQYERLFQGQRIFDVRKKSLTSSLDTAEERRIYEESLPNFPLDLLNIIFEYTLTREIDTPIESSYRETDGGENKSSCINNILKLASFLNYKDASHFQEVPFEEVK